MKAVILASELGARISEETHLGDFTEFAKVIASRLA